MENVLLRLDYGFTYTESTTNLCFMLFWFISDQILSHFVRKVIDTRIRKQLVSISPVFSQWM